MIEQLFDIIKLSISGIISLSTTYVILMRQNRQKKISDGIEFYRTNLPHILPIMKSISKLKTANDSLNIALENILEGRQGFPAMYNGITYLEHDQLKDLIESESKKLQELSNSEWLQIFPAILSIPITKIWYSMYTLSKTNWLENPKESIEKIKITSLAFRKYTVAINQVMGLTEAYYEICKKSPMYKKSFEDVLID